MTGNMSTQESSNAYSAVMAKMGRRHRAEVATLQREIKSLKSSCRQKGLIIFLLIIIAALLVFISYNVAETKVTVNALHTQSCIIEQQLDIIIEQQKALNKAVTPAADVELIPQASEPEPEMYDIPLSAELQEYTYRKCLEYGVDYLMVLAIMARESNFQADLISETGDYGLMQINISNLDYLTDAFGAQPDLLDPYQNIECGIFWLSGICQNNKDPHEILMTYNMNSRVARGYIERGQSSTRYSRGVLAAMEEIKKNRIEK